MRRNIDHQENTSGRDFFVGDLHGYLEQLLKKLVELDFDESRDRLFSTGDLIDRGEDSLDCLRLINKPWFYSVLGNHEEIFLDVLASDKDARPFTSRLHDSNGGLWARDLCSEEEQECCALIQSLPLARTVAYRGKHIGVVHAAWGWPWAELISDDELPPFKRNFATWARLDAPYLKKKVEGVDLVVSGHQNEKSILQLGNQRWIDTVGETGELSVIKAADLFSESFAPSHPFRQ